MKILPIFFQGGWLWILTLSFSMGLCARADQAANETAAKKPSEIPVECLTAQADGARLFGETMTLAPTKQRDQWALKVDSYPDKNCRFFFSQGIFLARYRFERTLAVQYWLDMEYARHQQWSDALKAQVTLEAEQNFQKFGLEPGELEEGGAFAIGSQWHRTALPKMIHAWKEAARITGKAQVFYRFIFTSGGAMERGYSLYDYERDQKGKLLRDTQGEPIKKLGSYAVAIHRLTLWSRAVIRDYQENQPTFIQRVFDPYYSLYAGRWAWDGHPKKMPREIREEEYPKQMAAYLRMAEELNLSHEDLQVFYHLYFELLHAQNANFAADDRALAKVQKFAIYTVKGGAAILGGGQALAVLYPKLGLAGAEAITAFATAAVELLGSQTVALLRERNEKAIQPGQRLNWATYLDHSVEAAMDFLPIASATPDVIVTVAGVGKFVFVSGPQMLANLRNSPSAFTSLRNITWSGAAEAVWQSPRKAWAWYWAHWWEARGMLKLVPYEVAEFAIPEIATRQFFMTGNDKFMLFDSNWRPKYVNRQSLISLTTEVIYLVLERPVWYLRNPAGRYVLQNSLVLFSDLISQAGFHASGQSKFSGSRLAFETVYNAAVGYWPVEGRVQVNHWLSDSGASEGRQKFIFLSLKMLEIGTVETTLHNVFLKWVTDRKVPVAEVRQFLWQQFHIDTSVVSDQDMQAGITKYLEQKPGLEIDSQAKVVDGTAVPAEIEAAGKW